MPLAKDTSQLWHTKYTGCGGWGCLNALVSLEAESYWRTSQMRSVMAAEEENQGSLGIRASVQTAVTGEGHSPGLLMVKRSGLVGGALETPSLFLFSLWTNRMSDEAQRFGSEPQGRQEDKQECRKHQSC